MKRALSVAALIAALLVGFAAGASLRAGETVTLTETRTQTREATAPTTILRTITEATTVYDTLRLTVTQPPITTTLQITETRTVTLRDGEVAVLHLCFSKTMDCASLIVSLIAGASSRVYVAVYSFTRDDVAQALISAHERGVDVKVLIEDERAYERESEYFRLGAEGVDVRRDGNPYLMHHKFIIIDGAIVVTGSYNLSAAAEDRNDENIIVLLSEELAKQYEEEFMRIWRIAQP
jgi:phosphatidylserine/phosphatidylglycerophosphate/cardiolipin synthase-like enzyme